MERLDSAAVGAVFPYLKRLSARMMAGLQYRMIHEDDDRMRARSNVSAKNLQKRPSLCCGKELTRPQAPPELGVQTQSCSICSSVGVCHSKRKDALVFPLAASNVYSFAPLRKRRVYFATRVFRGTGELGVGRKVCSFYPKFCLREGRKHRSELFDTKSGPTVLS